MANKDPDELPRVQVVTAGMFREGDPEAHDPDFFGNVIAQLHQHWIDPALAEREHAPDRVTQALVVLHPDRAHVSVNDEVTFTALAGEDARLARPQDCFVGHVSSLWPDAVDPDLAWSGYTTAQEGRVLVFDFRRNRERVLTLLKRSDEFRQAASLALDAGLLAPAVEHLHTAAELAVMTLIQLDGWNDHKQHRKRQQWLRQASEHRDIPTEFADAYERLAAERNPARYAEGTQALTSLDLSSLCSAVSQLAAFARARRGQDRAGDS